eukprot:scaffold9153_cov122-Isochrysis_galbana.AAC.5
MRPVVVRVLCLVQVTQDVRHHERAVEHYSPCSSVAQGDELVAQPELRLVDQIALIALGAHCAAVRLNRAAGHCERKPVSDDAQGA